MAILGEWRGDATSLLPGTGWAAPNGLFPNQARNDGSAYTFTSASSLLELPSSDLADGYLIIGAYEFEDDSNGRHNPQARFIQASGTGNFVSGASSGYNRDASEDRSYVRTWAFIDNPSAGAEVQFQWRRDTDAPTGGTERSQLQVIPLYYAAHGVYSSTSTACPGSTTPSQVVGWSVVSESDTAAIELASNVVTVKGDNKRYLCLGGQYWQGIGAARTQRWHGLRIDGTKDDTAKAYSYARNAANADIGDLFTTIVETVTADRTIDQFVYRGDSVSPFPASGADVTGNTTGSNPQHAMVVLELNDSAEVFQSQSDTQQDIDVAGTRVDLQIADTVNINDAASFTGSGTTGINVEQDMDVLLGANVSGGYASTSTARYTGYAEFTKNGTGEAYSVAGDYGRGNQGTQDTWGWSANLLGFVAANLNEDLGVDAGKITGGEGGTVDTFAGEVGFWGVNLDTLENSGGPGPQDVSGGDLVDADTFPGGGAAPGAVDVGAGGLADADTVAGGQVSAGPIGASGGGLSDPDTLVGGAVTPGAVVVGGLQITDPDAFGGGSVALNLGNALLNDPEAFFGGQVRLNVSGTLLADPDILGGGEVAPGPVTVSGALLVDPDTFFAGSASVGGAPSQDVAGGDVQDQDTLSGGDALAGQVVVGGGDFVDPDALRAGQAAPAAVAVSGTLYVDADLFGGGQATAGAISVSGVLVVDFDALRGGSAGSGPSQAAGGALDDADTLEGGTGAEGPVGVEGGGLTNDDDLSGGQASSGSVSTGGGLLADADALTGGAITALFTSGGAFADGDSIDGGAVTPGPVLVIGGGLNNLSEFFGGLGLPANFVWVPSRPRLPQRMTFSQRSSLPGRGSPVGRSALTVRRLH